VRRLPRVVLLLALLLAAPFLGGRPDPAAAGGPHAGKGKIFSLGNGTCDSADSTKLSPLIQQLMLPSDFCNGFGPNSGYDEPTVASAKERIMDMRANVQTAIILAKKKLSPACGAFLQSQFDNGNICVGWGMDDYGRMWDDSLSTKSPSEVILIRPNEILQFLYRSYNSEIVILSNTLMHETLHAGQEYGSDSTNFAQEQRALKKACNEIAAHDSTRAWTKKLVDALGVPGYVDGSLPLPAGLDPAVRCLLDSLRADAVGVDIAGTLRRNMRETMVHDSSAAFCYGEVKSAYQMFFAESTVAVPTRTDSLKARLHRVTWPQISTQFLNHEFISHYDVSFFRQYRPDTDALRTFDTGIRIHDLKLVFTPVERALLVSGETPSGVGELQIYRDTDGDSLFDPASKVVGFTGQIELTGGFEMFDDPLSGRWYIFDAGSGTAYLLVDTGSDGIPDALGPPATPAIPDLARWQSFEVDNEYAPGTPVLIGLPYRDPVAPVMLPGDIVPLLIDTNGDGVFEQAAPSLIQVRWDSFDWAPVLVTAGLAAGATTVGGYAQNTAILFYADANGFPATVAGLVPGLGMEDHGAVTLAAPLNPGDRLVLQDTGNGLLSSVFRVSSSTGAPDPVVKPPRLLAPVPSPSRASSVIAFTLDRAQPAGLSVLDVQGRLVAVLLNGPAEAGTHELRWPEGGSSRTSGVYFVVLETTGSRLTRRLVLLD